MMIERRFELHNETSHKFWQVIPDEKGTFTVQWGRIAGYGRGTTVQSQHGVLIEDVFKRIVYKRNKGYEEVKTRKYHLLHKSETSTGRVEEKENPEDDDFDFMTELKSL